MRPLTRVQYRKPDHQATPEDSIGTVIDYWDETPTHPFRATAMVRWDSGWVDDDIDPAELEVLD